MSFYSESSLFVEPAVYKQGKLFSVKPIDGSGDLTFSRVSDVATKVNKNGIIERVRTNLLLQSNDFDESPWSYDGTSVLGGQPSYDGTNTAWSLTKIASGFRSMFQPVTISGTYVFSIYARQGTRSKITIRDGASQYVIFNLSNGTIVFENAGAKGSIVNAGRGWYRCSVVMTTTNPNIQVYPDWDEAVAGNIFIQGGQLEVGDLATNYIPTTNIQASVGLNEDVPRLNYLNPQCPQLLIEPQRTNLILRSDQFDNASWNKAAASVTANNSVSPEGYTNADLITSTGVDGYVLPSNTNVFAAAAGKAFAYSVFLKAGTASTITLLVAATATYTAVFNLSTGVATTSTANTTASIVPFGNSWYRCIIVCSSVANTAYSELQIGRVASGLTFLAYGAQLESGASATSYIPTYGVAVTRPADYCRKQNISSLIGQSEGTLFLDYVFSSATGDNAYFGILNNDGTSAVRSFYTASSNTMQLDLVVAGVANTIGTFTPVDGTRYKIAIAYKTKNSAAYVNGSSIGSSVIEFSYSNLSTLSYDNPATQGQQVASGRYNNTLIIKERLSNDRLIKLTTV